LAALIFLGVAPRVLGEKFLGHFLDRKLENFKHHQEAEIEALKTKLGRIGDRGVRSNEREYAAVVAAWEAFVDAYIATNQCVMRFISHPDFSRMGEVDLTDYLETTELSGPQKKQLMQASDKNNMYAKIARHRLISQAGAAIYDARSILRKQGIFIPENLENSFEKALDILSKAQAHELVEANHGYFEDKQETIGKLFSDGPKIFSDLKTDVRKQIFLIE